MNTLIYTAILGLFSMFAEIVNLRKLILPVIVLGLAIIFGLNLNDWNIGSTHFNNMLKIDNFSVAFSGLSLFITLMVIILANDYFDTDEKNISDYMAIMVFVLCGAQLMFSFNNITLLFIGIETLSIGLYALAGSKRFDLRSNEAGFKYFLMGSFMSGILLFGLALIYGATGTFYIDEIGVYTSINAGVSNPKLTIGLSLVTFALLFKISAAPFHFWAPDVYEGAPPIITAYMSTLVKVAAFGAFYKLFSTSFAIVFGSVEYIILFAAIATLAIGNLTALVQTNFKRLLAFSGISHAGYMLLIILSLHTKPEGALLYYGLGYSLSTLAAFGVALAVFKQMNSEEISAFNGLGKKNPVLAAALTMAMLGLAGIPPFAGFTGKYYIFTKYLQTGNVMPVIVAVIASIIGVYYYFKVIIAMYGNPANEVEVKGSFGYNLVLWVCLAISLFIGIFPSTITQLL